MTQVDSERARKKVLTDLSFGQRIAEDEAQNLSNYFVETDLWRKLQSGEIDIVYGAKGSGKSALYSLLVNREDVLFDEGVIIVSAENPRGASAFSEIKIEPPTTEHEFIGVWKLYFVCLLAEKLREFGASSVDAKGLYATLEEAGFLQKRFNLQSLMNSVRQYAKKAFNAESVAGGLSVDSATGVLSGNLKISFREPSASMSIAGVVSVDALLVKADNAFVEIGLSSWVLMDRLDVAFEQSQDLEANALRALFRAYRDMTPLTHISLKIFLRTDIWDRIAKGGFREASHLTKNRSISWKRAQLVNLVVRRLLANPSLCAFYGVNASEVLENMQQQEAFLGRILPDQVDIGSKKLKTFQWMLRRTQDGTGRTAPRELIHLLSSLRDTQMDRLESGHGLPLGEVLFDRPVFKDALKSVSYERLNQTLYAEYDGVQPYVEKLRTEKTQQSVETLSAIWEMNPVQARQIADRLVEVGFFELRGSKVEPDYWVPFLYRDALEMIQGEARSE